MNRKENEIWKSIPNYEELYEVSDLGRVRRRKDNSFLKVFTDKKEYRRVKLKSKQFGIHQLVAMAFLDHIPCGVFKVVDHINEIRWDNRLTNLQILSNRENVVKSRKLKRELTGITYIRSQNKWKASIQLNKKLYYLALVDTAEEAASYYEEALNNFEKDGSLPEKKIFTSKYKGVNFHKAAGKWQARVQKDNIRVVLGYFDTEEEAFDKIKEYKKLHSMLGEEVNKLRDLCYNESFKAGWHTNLETGELIERNKGEMIALIHSEISEAMEGERKDLMDDHLPQRKMAEVEMADAVIRIMDYCGRWNYDIGGAIVEKIEYNRNRADHKLENRVKNGGKKF